MNIMVDIETLGSKKDACILSIGAVSFDVKGIYEEFYVNIDMQSSLQYGRTLDTRTIRWWLEQEKGAQKALFDPEPVQYDTGIMGFVKFVEKNLTSKGSIWANGVTFDLEILRHAINPTLLSEDNVMHKVPWSYKQECCMRPLRKLGPSIGLNYGEYKQKTEGVLHNALDDCKLQVEFVQDFMRRIDRGYKLSSMKVKG